MADVRVEVAGLKEFSRALKSVDKAYGKEVRQAFLSITNLVVDRTKASMRSGGRYSSKAAKGVKGKATQKAAAVRVTSGPGWTLAAVWGMRRRAGWYARRRYSDRGRRQAPAWVGNQWDPGESGGKPYHLGPAMNQSLDEAVEMLADSFEDLARRAFTD